MGVLQSRTPSYHPLRGTPPKHSFGGHPQNLQRVPASIFGNGSSACHSGSLAPQKESLVHGFVGDFERKATHKTMDEYKVGFLTHSRCRSRCVHAPQPRVRSRCVHSSCCTHRLVLFRWLDLPSGVTHTSVVHSRGGHLLQLRLLWQRSICRSTTSSEETPAPPLRRRRTRTARGTARVREESDPQNHGRVQGRPRIKPWTSTR